nr:hypothetical protein [Niallia circulans]
MKELIVGIFIYNEVEVLDVAGPFEVFSLAGGVYLASKKCIKRQSKM